MSGHQTLLNVQQHYQHFACGNLPMGFNHVGEYGLNRVEGTHSPSNVYLSWSHTVVVVCRLSLLLALVLGPGDYSPPSTSDLPGPKVARITR